jgi:LPXTG-motif cell wall-anchored protein
MYSTGSIGTGIFYGISGVCLFAALFIICLAFYKRKKQKNNIKKSRRQTTMKKHFSKAIVSIIMVTMLIITAIPFASAATLLDTEQTVSITTNCSKSGYKFEVYQVASLDNKATTAYETAYTPFFSEIASSVKSGKTKDILSDLDNLSTLPDSAVSCGVFDSSKAQTKTFDNLEQGIYYIKAIGYPAGVKRVEDSVIALPYFSSNSWVYSIDAINLAEKVQDDVPTTEKTITNSTRDNVNFTDVSLGDTVDFKLTNATAGSASIKLNTYAVYDDMSAGLTLDKTSFKVYLADKEGNKIEDVAANNYKVNITKEKSGENTTFNVALTSDYLAKDNFYASDVVYTIITYSATLNQYAVKGIAGNPNEDVKLEYGNTSTIDSVPGNKVYVYTWGVGVTKLDENGDKLAGAAFALYANENDTTALATGTSDSNGNVKFTTTDGYEINLESGNYFIKETSAPDGYNVYAQIIPITIDVTYGETISNETWVSNSPTDGYATCTVTDTQVVLPQTGGYVYIIYIAGAVCLMLGGVMFLLAKKMKKSKITK